jgi:hypothetical protein
MKNLIVILTLNIAVIATGFGADKLKDVKDRVGNTEILKNWTIGEVKEVNGVMITRVSGENTPYARTNILYTPFNQIQGTIEAKVASEKLSGETKEFMEEGFENCCVGGQVALFFDRDVEALANSSLFKLTVMNSDQTEIIYQKQLLKEAPHYYVQGIWYNYKVINIPLHLENNFVVKIEDEGLKQVYTFTIINNQIQKFEHKKESNPMTSAK